MNEKLKEFCAMISEPVIQIDNKDGHTVFVLQSKRQFSPPERDSIQEALKELQEYGARFVMLSPDFELFKSTPIEHLARRLFLSKAAENLTWEELPKANQDQFRKQVEDDFEDFFARLDRL